MGKYSKKKKKSTDRTVLTVLLTVVLILLAGMIWLAVCLGPQAVPTPEQTEAPDSGSTEAVPVPTEEDQTAEATEPPVIELGSGLVVRYISGYAGIYMEDGSGDLVTDVMMLLLENTAEEDLQLARISVEYSDFTAEFEVTNLPAGEKVVALEKNRQPKPDEKYQAIQAKNVVFFPETMRLQEERIRITGANGSLEVENISGEDITGDIWIYYKHSASDLLYGGITYRVSVKGGLAAGEKIRVIAGHYMVDSCRILQVDCGE
jgi:cytoskeletal protein RodZ